MMLLSAVKLVKLSLTYWVSIHVCV